MVVFQVWDIRYRCIVLLSLWKVCCFSSGEQPAAISNLTIPITPISGGGGGKGVKTATVLCCLSFSKKSKKSVCDNIETFCLNCQLLIGISTNFQRRWAKTSWIFLLLFSKICIVLSNLLTRKFKDKVCNICGQSHPLTLDIGRMESVIWHEASHILVNFLFFQNCIHILKDIIHILCLMSS